MFFYGIGHAMTDYFFDAAHMCTLPALLEPNQAVHISGDEFSDLLGALDKIDSQSDTPQDFPAAHTKETGGAVFNALKTARLLGIDAYFSGSCGKLPRRDDDAQFFQGAAARLGISTRLVTRQESSGRCLIVRTKNGTAIAASPESARDITVDQFEQHIAQKADCVLVEGMLGDELMRRVLSFCAGQKIPLALLCATPDGAQRSDFFLASYARQSDELPAFFVFANEREGKIIGERARVMRNTIYVETSGTGGGTIFGASPAPFVFEAAIPQKPVIDETGAGDVFAGVFLSLWFLNTAQKKSRGEDLLREICTRAAKAAAAVTTVPLCKVSSNDNSVLFKAPVVPFS